MMNHVSTEMEDDPEEVSVEQVKKQYCNKIRSQNVLISTLKDLQMDVKIFGE